MNNYNSLINSKSLYLRAHAFNPINWQEWNQENLKKALIEDKMIFLSIGYYSCYWCHVMEKEVFQDKEVSDILNKYFISIKVDKEEMPEIDNYYINFMYFINGHAGYPANFILTPNLDPFLSFTYLNKSQFKNLILNAIDFFYNQKDRVYEISKEISKNVSLFFNSKFNVFSLDKIRIEAVLEKIDKLFYSNLDINGGFNDSPKFPPHQILEYLLNKFEKVKSDKIYMMFSLTLDKMMTGGIYDHIDFGFYRYSVDNKWLVPHFEKMLYDNAYLLFLYTKAFTLTNNWYYFIVAYEIWEFLKREFLIIDNPIESAFVSSTSAISYIDSDKFEEGAYYLFTLDEIKSVLNNDELSFFKEYYDFEIENFYNFHTNYKGIIITKNSFEPDFYTYLKLNQIKSKLREYRKKRYKLIKDTKVITSWNLILSLCLLKAFNELNDYLNYYKFIFSKDINNNDNLKNIIYNIKEEFKIFAIKIVNFILNNLFKNDKLYHVYYDELKQSNYLLLEDYSHLLLNLVEQKRILKDIQLDNFQNLRISYDLDFLIDRLKNDILNYFYKDGILYDNFYINKDDFGIVKKLNSVSFLDSSISSNLSVFLNSFYYLDKQVFFNVLSNYFELIEVYPLSCGSLCNSASLFLFDSNFYYNYKFINNVIFINNKKYQVKNFKINQLKLDLDFEKLNDNCYYVKFDKNLDKNQLNDLSKLDLIFDICSDNECYNSKVVIFI